MRFVFFFFCQVEDGIRDLVRSRGLGDVYKRQTVTFEHQTGPQRGKQFTFTLVGVDEASVKQLRIAFTSPIARALMGNRVGETAEFQLGSVVQLLKIISIY